MKIKNIIVLFGLILCGCSTGNHILTGQSRPKVSYKQVKLYQVPPAKYEIIGIVNATSPGKSQMNMDGAMEILKEQAGAMGANGIIIGMVNGGASSVGTGVGNGFGGGNAFFASGVSTSSTGIQLSGQAIYVTQP